MPKPVNRFTFRDFTGGRNSRMTDLNVAQSPMGAMETPASLNVEYKKIGGFGKRKGKDQRGETTGSGNWYEQDVTQQDLEATGDQIADDGASWCQKINATSNTTISTVTIKDMETDQYNASIAEFGGNLVDGSVFVTIRADSSGDPGAVITNGTSDSFNPNGETDSPQDRTFTFSTPPSVTSGTDYWFCVEYQITGSTTVFPLLKIASLTTGSNLKKSEDKNSTFTAVTGSMRMIVVNAGATPVVVQGLYDYQVEDGSGGFDQKVMKVVNGTLYYQNGPITSSAGAWTSLKTGLGATQNTLFDFSVANNLLFTSDYGVTENQCWDGSNANTMDMGYRVTFSASDDATGGTGTWSGTGWVGIMAVTTMDSGGFRASGITKVNVDATTDHINVNTVKSDKASGEFTFDVQDDATLWFMTPVQSSSDDVDSALYYKIPDAAITNPDVGSATQPLADAVDNFDIVTDTGLTSENPFIDEYEKDQVYFTSQVATPKAKFLDSGFGFVAIAGDPSNPDRVWLSSQYQPQIWSTVGGTDGTFYTVGQENDGQKVLGVKFWGGGFYAFKDRDVYFYSYTADATFPFTPTKLKSNNMSALSHFAIVETPSGLVFPTTTGMAIIRPSSLVVEPLDQAKIGDLFENGNSNRLELSSMQYSTAANDTNRRIAVFGVSTNGATTRDRVLVHDYEIGNWSMGSGVAGNYLGVVSDADGFPEFWSGDYTGKLFKHNEGTDDDGSPISFEYETPWMVLGDAEGWKRVRRLAVKGEEQTSGTLTVKVFIDYADGVAEQTLTFDMSDTRFKSFLDVPVNIRCKAIKLKFENSEANTDVQVDAFAIYSQNLGAMK